MKKELRLDKIKVRKAKIVRQKQAASERPETSVKEDAVVASERQHRARQAQGQTFGTHLLELFNVQLVDFVRFEGDGIYIPVDFSGQATHKLVPTLWNKDDDSLGIAIGDAMSVCAEPLHVNLGRTGLIVRKRFPKKPPVYHLLGHVRGKQNVLRFLCEAMRAKIAKSLIAKMDSEECDLLYKNLIRASRLLAQERQKTRAEKQSTPNE